MRTTLSKLFSNKFVNVIIILCVLGEVVPATTRRLAHHVNTQQYRTR